MSGAHNLRCEFQANPINIGTDSPLLSWELDRDCETGQAACRVRVFRMTPAETETGPKKAADEAWTEELLADTGWMSTAGQRWNYAGPALRANEGARWQVKIRDGRGRESEWAEGCWQRGMNPGDWTAEWIGLDEGRELYDPSVPYYCADDFQKGVNHPFLPKPALLRHEFTLRKRPASALLYVTALGMTEMAVNGTRVTDHPLLPGICDFRKRCYSFAYDVTGQVRQGANAVTAVLADGWYAGYIGLNPREWWGKKPRLRAELHLLYPDGTEEKVVTGPEWRGCTGPWLYADMMHGCGYDARLEPEGWREPGFCGDGWQAVQTGAEREVPVYPHPGVPMAEGEPIRPAETERTGEDEVRIDFGVCFSGVIRLRVRGRRGTRIDIWHAEEKDRETGDLYLFGNRSAECHDQVILSGDAEEIFQPKFTCHGFCYARITGLKEAELISAEGIPIGSVTGGQTELETAHPAVNRAIDMIRNTAQCNLQDIVTDVCARDERLGWGCEGNLFLHTACAFGDMALFLRKWLQDALDGQQEDGCFWAIAPAVMMRDIQPFAGDLQSDIALHCTWLLMTCYDDRGTVERAFPALQAHVRWQERNSDRGLRFATGRDWLDLSRGGRSDTDHGYGGCDPVLLGTAWFAMDARMMAEIAEYLGRDPEKYRQLYGRVRNAFRTFFLGRNHLLRGATQGGALLAAVADLLEPEDVPAMRAWILEDMRKNGGITWGTATTPVALQGLQKLGLGAEAAAFLRREEYPSLGYMHRCGATTVWERWDAVKDGRFNPHPMNAFSHIGLATAGEWMLSGLVGLRPAAPGYREVILEPEPDRETGAAKAVYRSIYGPICAAWHIEADRLIVEAELPPGTRGTLLLPEEPIPAGKDRSPSGEKIRIPLPCGRTEVRAELQPEEQDGRKRR